MEYKIKKNFLPQNIYETQEAVNEQKVSAKGFIFVRINAPKLEGHNFKLLGIVFERLQKTQFSYHLQLYILMISEHVLRILMKIILILLEHCIAIG